MDRVRRKRMTKPVSILLTILASPFAIATPETFPIDAMLSAPFPVEIVAAPSTGRIAFVLNDKGVRNIWVADPDDYDARSITDYGSDDGVEITSLQFTPDAEWLVYQRGNAPNRAGELPNPRSDPEGGEMALYRVLVNGGAPEKIDDGAGAAIHPDGNSVAYVKKGEVFRARLDLPDLSDREEDEEPKRIFQARGGISQLRWSPDGQRLAFVSNRGTHSFIGIYRVTHGFSSLEGLTSSPAEIAWLDPSIDRDGAPVWSPDGKQIAFLRQPTLDRDQFPFRARRSDYPWSIRVANVQSGVGTEIWRADEGDGSVYHQTVSRDQLHWGAGNRIVFPWERDGWNHLYSVSIANGDVSQLTRGAFEVEFVTPAPDGGAVFVSSNQDDIDRRHIWRVPVDGSPATAITQGAGVEWSPQPLADGKRIAILRSDALRPARAALVHADGSVQDLAPDTFPDDFPVDQMVEPQLVMVTAVDGLEVHAQLFLPKDLKSGERRPAAIFLHGGSRRQMLLGWHKSNYYHNAYGMSQYLVSRGFIALALNYRSGIGYGLEFREAEHYGATGASEFNDVMGAGLYLKSRDDVDPERIGAWGGSYGGFLTAHALARASDLFAAGVDIHGVHDWNTGIEIFNPRYDPKDHPEASTLAWRSSPLHFVDGWRSPVLLIHGDDDRNVYFSQTARLVRELRRLDVEHEQLVFPDEVHGFLLHENWLKAFRATSEFLVEKLGE